MELSDIFKAGINIILPGKCPVCNEHVIRYPEVICSSCYRDISMSFSPLISSTSNIARIYSTSFYDGALKEAIILFKYYRKRELIYVFTVLLYFLLKEADLHIKKPDMIIPVPLYKKRKKKRGFNQSSDIAESAAFLLDLPVCSNMLLKNKDTRPQNGLTKKQRIRNLKGAFDVKDNMLIKNKHILLVDDVMTTGTTLNTCAEELIISGAEKITGLTLAKKM